MILMSLQSINKSFFKWGHHGIWLYLVLSFSHSLILSSPLARLGRISLIGNIQWCVSSMDHCLWGTGSFLLSSMLVLGSMGRDHAPTGIHHYDILWVSRSFILLLFLSLQISSHWFHFHFPSRCTWTSTWLGIGTSFGSETQHFRLVIFSCVKLRHRA